VRAPPRLRVALQGEIGSYSDAAIDQLWGRTAERVPCREFEHVISRVTSGDADVGVLPIENSIVGPIIAARGALAKAPELVVVGETVVDIHHCLLGLSDARLDLISTVLCHPVAGAQCAQFFSAHPQWRVLPWYDTAGAAMEVARLGDCTVAAVASRRAAHCYGLRIFQGGIEDHPRNCTRFIALARQQFTSSAHVV
jgi:prephenate dehydratase